jgi:hypothetical protein
LSPGGDPCVAEVKFRYLILDLRGSEGKNSRFRIPVLSRCHFDGGEFSLMGPFEESVTVDVEDATDFSWREEFFIHGRDVFY